MHLWLWYLDISSSRMVAIGMGLYHQPIQFSEIKAWSELHHIELKPWHLRAIRLLDGAERNGLSAKATDIRAEDLE